MDAKKVIETAKRDAHDYAYASANYGKGAGNRRKVIQMRIDERMSDPIYRRAFQEELSTIKYEPIVEKIEKRKVVENTCKETKKALSMAKRAYNIYDRNRDILEPLVRRILK